MMDYWLNNEVETTVMAVDVMLWQQMNKGMNNWRVADLKLANEIAVTRPGIIGQQQEAQIRISRQFDNGVIDEGVVTQMQHLQVLEMAESLWMDELDAIMVQVELAEVLQWLQLVSVESRQSIVIQMKNEQTFQTAERLIV